MITYEIEFHKVSSLPTNNENYRGHVFFNDATNEPIETTIDEEGNEVQKRRYERGIYLCAYDGTGKLSYIPYTVAGAGGDDVGMDIDTLNDRIALWASKLQNDIQKLAKLTVDPDQIMAQVRKFYNELNGEIADLRIKSDQIKADVAKDINGVREQYSQFTIEADKINSKVENLKTGLSRVEQTANGITSRVENLESGWSQVEQTATELRTTVNDNINNLSSRVSQTASTISSVVENLDNVKSQIEQLPNQIKMDVSDGLDSASIIARINDGDSEVKIKADKIVLDGAAIANSLKLDGGQATTDLFNQYKNTITDDLQASIDDLRTRVDDTIDNWYYDHYPVDWSDASHAYASNSISYNTEHNISQDTIEVALGQSTTPKVDVEPYASWVKDGKDDRQAHIGDTFTNTKFSGQSDVRDGRTWKFCATTNPDGSYTNYRWEPMSDSASVAMRAITDLENKVSNKRQVFVDTPTPPYERGDLWVIMESTGGNTSAKNIYVCTTPKDSGATFSNADWISTNNFVGEDVLEAAVDSAKSELVDTIREKVAEVDLREVLERGGFIESKNGSYVPASGLLSEYTDANGVTTLTMQVGGEPITWQKTTGKDAKGNEFLVVDTPFGDPDRSSFVVSKEGLLEAHNAVIYGEIHAGKGAIGGITIGDNSISSSNGNFRVTSAGELTVKNANIEGTIKATSLEIGDGVTIPQGKVYGLGDNLNNIQSIATTAKDAANIAKSAATGATSIATAAANAAETAVNTANSAMDTAASAVNTAANASDIASEAKSNLSSLQSDLSKLQSDVAEYLKNGSSGGSSGNTTPDWITNAFSQTLSNGGLLLSGNIFVANSDGYINAGMMGASGVEPSKTPRFFAGESGLPKNGELSPGIIFNQKYPFIVTADGHLYAKNADLTGSLKVTRTIGGEEQSFDIADYVIGKMTNGKLDTKGTVTEAINVINDEVYGPVKSKDESDTDHIYNLMSSKTLLGKILRLEGKITALQRDIDALQASQSGSSSDKVIFVCSNCGKSTTRTASKQISPSEACSGDHNSKYSEVDKIKCPTTNCGAIAYKRRLFIENIDTGGDTGGGTGSGSGLITGIEIRPRPNLPIASKGTVADSRPLES